MWRLLVTLSLVLVAHAGAQDLQECGGHPGLPTGARDGIYRGPLGGRPTALQVSGKEYGGLRYLYERTGLDIQLTAFHRGAALILQEEVRRRLAGDTVVRGCSTLIRSGNRLKGTWHAHEKPAQALPITLNALNVKELPLNRPSTPGLLMLRRDDPLAFLKLNRAWVKTGDGRRVREPISQITDPRIPGRSAALNGALQDRHLHNAADALDCRSQLPEDAQRDPTDGHQLTANVTLLTSALVSVREGVSSSCGGAHPDEFTRGLILDRAAGRAFTLARLWRGLTAAKQVALYLAHPAPDLDPQCWDVLTQSDLAFTAHLSPAGLNLTPIGLPHVVSACGDTVVIPDAELRAQSDTHSAYFRDLYPR